MTPATPGAAPPIVGLRREREVLTVALAAGRHVVIEGPPGTGKSTLLRDIARQAGQDVVFAEGNAELTPARLIGAYDPAQVLAAGYVPGSFTDGPLLRAMRTGALLYLEEFNRIPEETVNVLITVLTEGEIAVPRLGMVPASPGFRLVAAMNPFDAVGTARVSHAVADRICRVVLGYQDAAAEREITTSVTGEAGPGVRFAVALTRATREHPDLRMGSSVRGAIDLVLLLAGLTRLRGEDRLTRDTARDAAYAALSGRIRLADGCDRTPESVLDDLLAELWPDGAAQPAVPEPGTGPGSAPDGRGKADGLPSGAAQYRPGGLRPGVPGPGAARPARARPARSTAGALPAGAAARRDRLRGGGQRRTGRAELAARHPALAAVSPAVGQLDTGELGALLAADPEAAVLLLADLARATDAGLRAAARVVAARVFFRLARDGTRPARGTRRLVPGRAEGDLDLEATLDRLDGPWPPRPDDLVTSRWEARSRSVCLLIDVSGSMSGLAVAIAAVTAAGLVLATGPAMTPGIAAFGAGVTVLQSPGQARAAPELLGELLALRGHGLTDLAAALRAAAAQLAMAPAGERIVLLLSDCVPTTGGDPAAALGGIDRLHVMCPLPSAAAGEAASALARRGHGLSQPLRRVADVPAALTRVLR